MSDAPENRDPSLDERIPPSGSLVAAGEPMLPADMSWMAGDTAWLDGGGKPKDSAITPIGFLHSLRRSWLLASLLGAAVAAIVAVLLWLFVPVNYEAVSLLRVLRTAPEIIGGTTRIMAQKDYETFKQTQAELIRSPYVLTAAKRGSGIQQLSMIEDEEPNAVGWLASALSTTYPGQSEILRVSLKGEDPDQPVKIVDAVVEAYLAEIAQSEREERIGRLDTLRIQYGENMREIREKNKIIYRLADELGTDDSEQAKMNQQIEWSRLKDLERRRDQLKRELSEFRMQYVVYQAGTRSRTFTPSPYQIEDELERDLGYVTAKQEVEYLQEQYQQMAGTVRSGSPAMARLSQPLAAAKRKLEQKRADLEPRVIDRIKRAEGFDDSEDRMQLQMMGTQANIKQQELEAIEKEVNQQYDLLKNLRGFSSDLLARKQDLESQKVTTDEISQEIQRLELRVKNPPRIIRLQPAMIPDENSARMVLSLIFVASLMSFLVTSAAVAMVDLFARKMSSPEELEGGRDQLHVVGTLPKLNAGRSRDADITSSIDSIRSAIVFGGEGREICSVMVTSALGQEGKSTVASQLAVSLARSGKRTLLVDADIRNPSQHLVFGLPGDRGLCQTLTGQVDVEEAIQQTPAEGLSILTAGTFDNAASQALGGPMVGAVLKEITSKFDFVVIDTGPVLTGPEAVIIGQFVDAAILSTRRDVSRLPKVHEAQQRLKSVGIHVIGAVANGIKSDRRTGQAKITSVAGT